MTEIYPIVCVCHIFFIHSSIDVHLCYFHVLVIADNASVNMGVRVSFWGSDFVS